MNVACRITRGSFGNNLFFLAAALELVDKYGYNLVLSDDFLDEAPCFNHDFTQYIDNEEYVRLRKENFYCSADFGFSSIPIGKDIFLGTENDGCYYQSPKFFNHVAPRLKGEYFQPSQLITDGMEEVFGKHDLFDKKVTSIHVRLGDYIYQHGAHPVLDVSYYEKAINHLKDKTDVFLVFSNSMDICKQRFKKIRENLIFVTTSNQIHDGCFLTSSQKWSPLNAVDLYTMANCDNHIIANSSYSYWGALLGYNPNRTVISPSEKMWFGPCKNMNTKDLIPEDWIQINA